jgi:hypothetical protein
MKTLSKGKQVRHVINKTVLTVSREAKYVIVIYVEAWIIK